MNLYCFFPLVLHFAGIFYGLSAIGPGIGYMVGGAFLNIYTDFGSVNLSTLDLTPRDPGWVGAWWLGFIIGGAIAFLVAVPILGFPSELPGEFILIVRRANLVRCLKTIGALLCIHHVHFKTEAVEIQKETIFWSPVKVSNQRP